MVFDREMVDRLSLCYKQIPDAGIISPIQMLPNGKVANFRSLGFPTFWKDFFYYLIPSRKFHTYYENTDHKDIQKVYEVPGAFMFADYKRLAAVDFFFEGTFLYNEEYFIAERLKEKGWHNYVVLNETYVHEHGKTINSEKSRHQQYNLIFEGRLLFGRLVRHDSSLQQFSLKLVYCWYLLRISVENRLRRMLKR